ncbi:MAG: MIP/aquaporin family protein [Phycisphaerae bacterium]
MSTLFATLFDHWPEYAMEAALLGCFMLSACSFGTLLGHPASPIVRRVTSATSRRALMGIAMGMTAITLIYSPWGLQSGAHMNPATTITFALRGKVAAIDAVFYVLAQFSGGAIGVMLARTFIGGALRHAAVNHVVTLPGSRGVSVAWLAEVAIAYGMMLMVLLVSNSPPLAAYTGICAGVLVALYIFFEAPLSGMSMNPARSFASAVVARQWRAIWVYFTAPLAGMLLASATYAAVPGAGEVLCAKLVHTGKCRCIFHCEWHRENAASRR